MSRFKTANDLAALFRVTLIQLTDQFSITSVEPGYFTVLDPESGDEYAVEVIKLTPLPSE